MTTLQQPQHPVLGAVVAITGALEQVAEANPAFMATDQKAATMLEIARAKVQLAELELRVLAVADDVAAESAARDMAGWLHHHTHQRPESLRADLRLAQALDRTYHQVAAAMRAGACNPAQALVIVAALDDLPADLDPEVRVKAEETLVGYATEFDPTQLRRLGRRILDVIAPEIAEAEEAKRLAAEEAHARKKTRPSMRRLGDGTTRITAVVPDAAADRLATNLEAFASPRRDDGTRTATGDYLPYDRRLGLAFCQLLETLDPQRLPIHGGDATTVIVTIDIDQLRKEAGARRSSVAARSPQPKPGAWPAPPASSPPSSGVTPRSSTWAARNGSSPPPNAARSCSGQQPARPRAATSRALGQRPTTGSNGPKAVGLTWTTPPCSAPITTTAPTTPRTSTNACPTATSASTDARRR